MPSFTNYEFFLHFAYFVFCNCKISLLFVKVVVLDTDVFFLADIAELWNLFHKFSKTEVSICLRTQKIVILCYRIWVSFSSKFILIDCI